MKSGLRVLAVVPARGGDDQVPYLNIKKLGPLPLVAHTLVEAGKCKESGTIDRLVVSTDDDQVAQVAVEYGAEAPFRRPKELAGDVPIQAVVRHAVELVEQEEGARYDVVVTLQATSPFRTSRQIDAAIDRLIEEGLDAVISLKELRSLTWRMPGGKLEPLFERAGRREELEPLYQEDGAIRVVRREVLDSSDRLGTRVGHVLMDKMSSLTVHDIYDFWLAERLFHLPRVLFRVDGGGSMGMGHVYRSLAVAQALSEAVPHSDVCFLMSAEHPEGVQQVSRAGYPVRILGRSEEQDLERVLESIRDYSPNVIVNDRPMVEEGYLRALARLGASVINLVDTLADIERPADLATIIIATMQEEQSDLEDYHGGVAILRDSFRRRPAAAEPGGRRLVLTFGGSDPQGLTLKALEALEGLPDLDVTAVLGPAFAYSKELDRLLGSLRDPPRVLRNVEHMADVLQDADLVLCSGGMTVFEIAALGRPGVVLSQNARELERMNSFCRYGTVVHLGLGTEVGERGLREQVSALLEDGARRRRMSEAGARLVDGSGAQRAASVLKQAGGRGPANGGRRE